MPPLVQCPRPKKFFIVVFCALAVCGSTPLALAQHTAVHAAGGVAHIPSPPISRAPISAAPVIRAPILYAPISSSRMSIAPSAGALGMTGFRPPRRPFRPFPPVLVIYEPPFFLDSPFWRSNSCGWTACDFLSSWTLNYTPASSPGSTNDISQVYETPEYVYGEERPDLPQLFLKDGTMLNVSDYWLVDGQLHFTMTEEDGTKPAEHTIPFDALDLQTTVNANTRRGFRFMLRNEPFEQYLRDHPEGPPPALTPPQQ